MTTMMMIHHSAGSLKQQANGNPSATRQMDEHQFGRIEHQFAISSSSNFTAAAEQQASSTSRPASSASNSATQDDQYQLLAIKQHHQQPTTNDHFFAAKSGPEGGATLQVPEQHQDLQDAALHYYGAKSLHLGSNYHYQTQANLNRAFQQQQQQQQQPVLSSSNCTGATAATSQQFVHDYYQAEYSTVQPANAICHNTTLPANALNAASLTGSYYSSGFPCESSIHQAHYGSPADYYQNYQHYQSLAAQQSQQVESTSYLGSLYEQQYSGQSVAAPSQPADGFVAGHPLTPTQHPERRSTPIQASSHARRLQRFAQLASSYQSCTASYPASVAPPPQHQSRLVRSVNKLKPTDRLQRVQSSSTCDELGTASGPPKIMSRRKNATRETTATLKAWLDENGHNPYPTKGEKMLLSMVTRMSQVQISTWFANARRRMKKENRAGWPSQRLQVSGSNSAGSGQAQVGTADGLAAMRSFLCRYQERLAAEGKSPALLAQISGGLQLHGFSLVTDNKSCTRLHSLVSLGGPRSSSCVKAPPPPSSSSSSEGSCSSAASDQSTGSPRGEPSSTTGNCDRIV